MSEDRQPARDGQQQPSTQAAEHAAPTRQPLGARSPGRRGFLLGAGGLAAAALVGGGGWLASEQGTSGPADPVSSTPRPGQDRRWTWRPAGPARSSCASPPPASSCATRSPNPNPTATKTATTSLGWPTSPKPCPTTTSARSTRPPTAPCCGRLAAAARRTSRASRWAAGSSWPTPRAPSPSSCKAPTPGSGPWPRHQP
jgi:hypothetical protein